MEVKHCIICGGPLPPSRGVFCERRKCIRTFRSRYSAWVVTVMFGSKCFVCGSQAIPNIDRNTIPGFVLHHRTYELDSVVCSQSKQRRREAMRYPYRFCLLCKGCHNLVNRIHKLPKNAQARLRKLVAEQGKTWAKHERLKRDAEDGVRVRGRREPTPEEWDQLRREARGVITAQEQPLWGDQIDEEDLSDNEEPA